MDRTGRRHRPRHRRPAPCPPPTGGNAPARSPRSTRLGASPRATSRRRSPHGHPAPRPRRPHHLGPFRKAPHPPGAPLAGSEGAHRPHPRLPPRTHHRARRTRRRDGHRRGPRRRDRHPGSLRHRLARRLPYRPRPSRLTPRRGNLRGHPPLRGGVQAGRRPVAHGEVRHHGPRAAPGARGALPRGDPLRAAVSAGRRRERAPAALHGREGADQPLPLQRRAVRLPRRHRALAGLRRPVRGGSLRQRPVRGHRQLQPWPSLLELHPRRGGRPARPGGPPRRHLRVRPARRPPPGRRAHSLRTDSFVFGKPQFLSCAGRAVVVTGASTGLGRACALDLERRGFRVYAGVRKESDGERLAAASEHGRIRPLVVDLSREETVREAARTVAAAAGDHGLWGLVNNAGVCVSAPLECVPPARLREQLDVNVVGSVVVIQSFLPLLRRAAGRIVNVTSGMGSVASPYLGPYSAAQFAKEAVSDALRRELAPAGIGVSVVQPGAIMTPIWGKVSDSGERLLDAVPDGIAGHYRDTFLRFLETNARKARESRTRPEDFTAAVRHALTAARPRTRYRVGPDARGAGVAARLLPDTTLDRLFSGITRGAGRPAAAPTAPARPFERTP
ncbi:hypothetical protein CTZ27_08360 [Streptomyces griseocarneus]|nr:hypothetical protein CTZ27_08360 [Streptomyces griseocarneus]